MLCLAVSDSLMPQDGEFEVVSIDDDKRSVMTQTLQYMEGGGRGRGRGSWRGRGF